MPHEVNSSRNVTKVVELIDATGIESICKAGDVCRMNIATRRGIVAIVVPLASFIEKARGERDHHGNRFERPSFGTDVQKCTRANLTAATVQERCDAVANEEPEPAGAESWRDLPVIGPLTTGKRKHSPAVIAALRDAWRVFIADPSLSLQRLSIIVGVSDTCLRAHFARFAKEPGAPLLKPNGRLA